jgi:hypothetical protein
MQIVDPTDERSVVQRSLAPRPGELKGTVALLDISKPRGDVLIARLEERLRQEHPDLEFKHYSKPHYMRVAPLDLYQQIKDECDFVIEAMAD